MLGVMTSKKLISHLIYRLVSYSMGLVLLWVGSMSVMALDISSSPFVDPEYVWPVSDINLQGTAWVEWDALIDVIRWAINRLLWVLWLIALVMLIRWGLQMITAAGNEERYNNGFKILKQAAIWLAFIGVSWFIVSMILYVIYLVTGPAAWWA